MYRHRTVTLSATAAACAIALSAVPAAAAPTYTVKAGTQTTGTAAWTAASTGASPQISFADATSGLSVSCDSSTAAGAFNLGTKLAGAGLATIASSTFTGCLGPLNLAMKVTQTSVWVVNGTGTTSATGVTAGTVSNISATSAAVQGGCTFTVSGSVPGALTTTSKKQLLAVKPTASLTISNVIGCFGQVRSGDKASIRATWAVTAGPGKLQISNP